jgi:dUTP pyrophosphatase
MMANGVGIIDADYCNNPDNEGEIFFQLFNLSPFNLQIKKGEAIGQGIVLPFGITDDDVAMGERVGGFGSTSN